MANSQPPPENPFTDSAATASLMSYDMGDGASSILEPATAGFKKFRMYYTTSRTNVTFHLGRASESSPALYYLETKALGTGPQLLLRRGATKNDPIISYGRIPVFSSGQKMFMANGDPTGKKMDDLEPQCQLLRREKNMFRRSDYRVSFQGREFGWRKDKSRHLKTVYDCVEFTGGDEDNGENAQVIARLFSGGAFNFKKGGELELLESSVEGNQDLESFLVMAAAGIWVFEAGYYRSLLQGFDKDAEEDKAGNGK